MATNFAKLLEQSQQITASIAPSEFFIQRDIGQIDQTSKQLAVKTSRTGGDLSKNKAVYLLAGKGFDAEKLSRNLQSVNVKSTFEPLEPLAETDVDGYLKHEYDMIILTAIEEAKKETATKFRKSFSESLEGDWQKRKQKLKEETSFGTGKAKLMREPYPGSPQMWSGRRGPTTMSNKMLRYAQIIAKLDEERASGRPFPLVDTFMKVSEIMDEREVRKVEIIDCWSMLKTMLFPDSSSMELAESHYRSAYLHSDPLLKKQLLQGAKNFLEKQYLQLVQNKIKMNPARAMVGPIHQIISLVRGYLRMKYNISSQPWPEDLEILADFPIWAEIYYCLRTGHVDAAIEAAKAAQAITGNFASQLLDYKNGDYTKKGKVSNLEGTDPYKTVVYAIVTGVDMHMPTKVVETIQDFLWVKLSLVRDMEESGVPSLAPSKSPLSLEKLQKLLVQYGPSHFTNPIVYFQVLLLSQQFELALRHLCSSEVYFVDAVHFAIALYYYGLLHLRPVKPNSPTFDLISLLQQFGSQFIGTDPVDVLQYLAVLHETEAQPSPVSISLRGKAFKALIASRPPQEFEFFFGVDDNGVVQKLLSIGNGVEKGKEEGKRMMLELAAEFEENSRYEESVKLFEMCKDYGKVLDTVNRLLGKVLTDRRPEREKAILLANHLYQKNQQFHIFAAIPSQKIDTFNKLMTLIYFFDLYDQQRYEEALVRMEYLDLIPFTLDAVEQKARMFETLDISIQKNISDILLTTMAILNRMYQTLKSSPLYRYEPGRDGGVKQKMKELKDRARSVVMFSGRISYKILGETNAQLIRIEVSMS